MREENIFRSYFKDCFLIHSIEQLRWLEAILDRSLEKALRKINKSEIEESCYLPPQSQQPSFEKHSRDVKEETNTFQGKKDYRILIDKTLKMLR